MSDEKFPRVPKEALDLQSRLQKIPGTGKTFSELGLGVMDDIELNRLIAVRFEGTEYDDDDITEAITNPETKVFQSADNEYFVIEFHMNDGEVFPVPVLKSLFITYQ